MYRHLANFCSVECVSVIYSHKGVALNLKLHKMRASLSG